MYKTKKQLDNIERSTMNKPILQKNEVINKNVISNELHDGFELLLHKIDKIEQSQGQVVQSQDNLIKKVEKIDATLHDPNDGLFSKLAEFKLDVKQQTNDINNVLIQMNEWKKHREKQEQKNDEVVDATSKDLVALRGTVGSIVKSRNNAWALMKWLAVAVGGGILTLLFKWLENKI